MGRWLVWFGLACFCWLCVHACECALCTTYTKSRVWEVKTHDTNIHKMWFRFKLKRVNLHIIFTIAHFILGVVWITCATELWLKYTLMYCVWCVLWRLFLLFNLVLIINSKCHPDRQNGSFYGRNEKVCLLICLILKEWNIHISGRHLVFVWLIIKCLVYPFLFSLMRVMLVCALSLWYARVSCIYVYICSQQVNHFHSMLSYRKSTLFRNWLFKFYKLCAQCGNYYEHTALNIQYSILYIYKDMTHGIFCIV